MPKIRLELDLDQFLAGLPRFITYEGAAPVVPFDELRRALMLATRRNTTWPAPSPSDACDFCGKLRTQVKRLISGNAHFICDECAQLTADLLYEGEPSVVIAARDAVCMHADRICPKCEHAVEQKCACGASIWGEGRPHHPNCARMPGPPRIVLTRDMVIDTNGYRLQVTRGEAVAAPTLLSALKPGAGLTKADCVASSTPPPDRGDGICAHCLFAIEDH
jgi:hypothetical protein